MAGEKDELLQGDHDGIQEYDNDLPRWWLYLFYLTIVFALIYPIYYHGGFTTNAVETLALEMKALEEIRSKNSHEARPTELKDDDILVLAKEPAKLQIGQNIYAGKCMPCHGPQGQGLIGPNLTDDYWIHGGNALSIKAIIENGVAEKGMVPWRGVLSDDEIKSVTAYIVTLRGTNPPNPKAAQGELVR